MSERERTIRTLVATACCIALAGAASAYSPDEILQMHFENDDCNTYKFSTTKQKVRLKPSSSMVWLIFNMGPSDVVAGSGPYQVIPKWNGTLNDNYYTVFGGRGYLPLRLAENGRNAKVYVCIP